MFSTWKMLNYMHFSFLQMLRDRVEDLDADNRLVVHERHQISLQINSNEVLVGLAAAVRAFGAVYCILKRQ